MDVLDMADDDDSLYGTTVFNLCDAPDTGIGEPEESTKAGQIFQIQLAQDLVREMQQHTKSSKGIHLNLGKAPMLRYGTKSRPLHIRPSTFRNELYRQESDESQDMSFVGLISHDITFKKVEESIAGADSAMAALKAQMASYREDKEANQIKVDETMGPAKNNKKQLNKRPNHLNISNATHSRPSSPAIYSTSFISNSSNKSAARTQAQRLALLHFLAIGASSETTVLKKTAIPKPECDSLLEKFGKQTQPGHWQLGEKWFKELDIWTFPYPSQKDRQSAIDNAVRAFDRQRLSREDKLWQLLLPKEERGKGKILSKLNMNGGHTPQPSTSTSGSIGALSEASAKHLSALNPESSARSASQEPPKMKKVSEKEAMSKRLFSKKPPQTVRPPRGIVKEKAGDEKEKSLKETKATETAAVKAGVKRKTDPKIKSAEFVGDSGDEEGEIAAPAAKRLKTVTGAVKASPQVHAVGSKLGQDARKASSVKAEQPVKAPAAKSSSTSGITSTPKTQAAVSKSTASVETLRHPKDGSEGAKASAVKSGSNALPKSDVPGSRIAKPESLGVTAQRKSIPVSAQPQKQTQLAKQPTAPASASSASSSSFWSSLASASHRHSSSQSSASSAASAITRPAPVIQKRMVTVDRKTRKMISDDPVTLPKKRKMESPAAKPSSLGASPPVNASDSDGQASDNSQAISMADSPSFAAATPGPDIDMLDAPTPISRVSSGERLSSSTLSLASPTATLPAKLPVVVQPASTLSTTYLDGKRDAALDEYLRARMEADRVYPDDKPAEVKENLWRLHNALHYLQREVEARLAGIDYTETEIATLSNVVPENSSAFFQNKIHEIWPRYCFMYDEVAALEKPSQAQLKALCQLDQEVKDLQRLHQAALRKDRYTQITMLNSPHSTTNDSSDVPLSRSEVLRMYAHFQRSLGAYTSFQHECRTLPSFPELPPEKHAQDAKMFDKLSEMRKEIFGGFADIIRVHNLRPTGTIRLSEFLEEHDMPTHFMAELETWRMRNCLNKWTTHYHGVKKDFGRMTAEDMNELWDELDAIKRWERKLVAAVALDFGKKEQAELGDVSLDKFEPFDGSKGFSRKEE